MPTLWVAINAAKAKQGASQFNQAAGQVKSSAGAAAGAVGRFDGRISRLGKTAQMVKRHLGGLFAGIGAAMVLRNATRTIEGFETSMLTVKGVTGATEAQFAQLTDTARTLGATTRYSAQEAAEGLLFLGRAGFSVEESITALPATLNLATAGAIGLGQAADIASNVLSQFGLAANETERVVDTLIHTANSANTNVSQLAEAMKMAGPVAGALGISVEETAASIGALGDAGIQGSMAGTQLRGAMAALLGPTAKAKKALTELKLSVDQVNPATNTFVEILQRLKDAGMEADQALAIFGRRNMAGMLIMTEAAEKIRKLTLENTIAIGEAQRLAEVMDSGLGGAFKNLKSVVEEAMLKMGDGGLTGVLKSTVNKVTDVMRALVGMDKHIKGSVGSAKLLANSLKFLAKMALLVVGIKLALWAQAAIVSLGSLAAVISTLGRALIALETIVLSHPILAFVALIGTAYLAFNSFTDSVETNTESLAKHQEELDKLRILLPQVEDAQKKYNRAIAENNAINRASAINDQIRLLEAYQTQLFPDKFTTTRVEDVVKQLGEGSKAAQSFLSYLKQITFERERAAKIRATYGNGLTPVTPPYAGESPEGPLPTEIYTRLVPKFVISRIKEYRKEFELLNPVLDKAAREKARVSQQKMFDQKELDAIEDAKENLEKLGKSLSAKFMVAGISDPELKKLAEFRATITDIASKTGLQKDEQAKVVKELEKTYKATVSLERFAKEDRAAAKKADAGQKSIEQMIKSLKDQATILKKINVERSVETTLIRARDIASEAGIELTDKQLKALKGLTAEVYKLQEADRQRRKLVKDTNKEVEDALKAQKELSDSLGKSVGDAFASMVTGAKSAQDAIRDLATEILSLIAQKSIAKPIADFIGDSLFSFGDSLFSFGNTQGNLVSSGSTPGLPSAKGNAFAFAGAFADGGIVHRPSMALMGEAGPEAVLPLRRGPGGRLGVQSSPGNVSIKINITNESSSEVKAEQGQTEFNGREYVVGVVLQDLNNNGPIRQRLGSRN